MRDSLNGRPAVFSEELAMTEQMGRQIVLAARPQGSVRLTDLQVKNSPIPTIPAGGLLLEVNYLSLDPYMRGRMDDRKSYAEPTKVGDVMTGETINTVVGSNHPDFATGEMVLAYAGCVRMQRFNLPPSNL